MLFQRFFVRTVALAAMWVVFAGPSNAETKTLWFVPPASNQTQQGFIRITNPNTVPVQVSFLGVDDAGQVSQGSASFTLQSFESKQFNSTDIELGNPAKGLTGSLGIGSGNWRIELQASAQIVASALIRTTTGFLTSVQDPDPNKVDLSVLFNFPMVNPGENPNQVSILRFVNPNNATATISIYGVDDSGVRHPSQGALALTIAPQQAVQLLSSELESGVIDKGLSGALGDGVGKWNIVATSDIPIKVLNLLFDPNGFISELPTEGSNLTDVGYFGCPDFEGAMVFSQDDRPIFLGFFGSNFSTDSINNQFGPYGSAFSSTSMRNSFSSYGSQFSNVSALNPFAQNPPVVVKNGKKIGHITVNTSIINSVALSTIDASCTFVGSQRDPW